MNFNYSIASSSEIETSNRFTTDTKEDSMMTNYGTSEAEQLPGLSHVYSLSSGMGVTYDDNTLNLRFDLDINFDSDFVLNTPNGFEKEFKSKFQPDSNADANKCTQNKQQSSDDEDTQTNSNFSDQTNRDSTIKKHFTGKMCTNFQRNSKKRANTKLVRMKTIFKKAKEISTLCDLQAAVIILDKKTLKTYFTNESLEVNLQPILEDALKKVMPFACSSVLRL